METAESFRGGEEEANQTPWSSSSESDEVEDKVEDGVAMGVGMRFEDETETETGRGRRGICDSSAGRLGGSRASRGDGRNTEE